MRHKGICRALNVAARGAVEFQPICGRRNMNKRLAKFFYIRKQNLCYVLHWQDFCCLNFYSQGKTMDELIVMYSKRRAPDMPEIYHQYTLCFMKHMIELNKQKDFGK
jgi:hypothetical protein